MKYIVKVIPKIKSNNLLEQVKSLGYKNLERISLNKLYMFKGNIEKEKIFYITKVLLVDPIVEEFQIYSSIKRSDSQTIINIWYQPQVLDVVSLYVAKGIKYLGIKENLEIHTGIQFYISPKYDEKKIKDLIEKNFMNPLIQYYEVI